MTRLPTRRSVPPALQGITLVEVLIALAVVAIGTLALGALHGALIRHADLARQRTEATHLAQAKLEELRAFERILAGGGQRAYADLGDGEDQPGLASNTAFHRRWSVVPSEPDRERNIEIRVDWLERHGEPAEVSLRSLIARGDPADRGRLALPLPPERRLQRPLDRALDIPLEAIPLYGARPGRSVLRWPGDTASYLVFDDLNGEVLAQCGAPPDARTDLAVDCTPLPAYLLRGYLRGDGAAAVVRVAFTDTQYLLAAPQCTIGDALDPFDGQALAGWRRYACLMRAADHDGNAGTPRAWTGRSMLEPAPSGTQQVCRDTPDATTVINDEHPAIYRLVTTSLSNQNFLLLAAGPCPPGTALHQP